MSAAPRRLVRALLLLAGLLVAMGAAQGVARGAITLSSATLAGGTTGLSTPAGGVIPASVRGGVNQGDRWRSTAWAFGNQTPDCVDHSDQTGNNKTVDFEVTAPGTPGTYNASFTGRGQNDCSGVQSNTITLSNALRVTAPAPNPNLSPRCGIDVIWRWWGGVSVLPPSFAC